MQAGMGNGGTMVPSVEGSIFRDLMSLHTAAVCLITCADGEGRYGLTASAVMSMTANPPQIVAAVNADSDTLQPLLRAGTFSVNLLADDQAELATKFADFKFRDVRFSHGDWTTLVTGAPVLQGSVYSVDCVLMQDILIDTHSLLIGRIVGAHSDPDKEPLLYRQRRWYGQKQLPDPRS